MLKVVVCFQEAYVSESNRPIGVPVVPTSVAIRAPVQSIVILNLFDPQFMINPVVGNSKSPVIVPPPKGSKSLCVCISGPAILSITRAIGQE